MAKIRVMIVDDSAVARQAIRQDLEREPDMEVLGAAADPIFAMQRMQHAWPDVLILDIEMPRMDGLTFLRKVMAERPTPVIVCSTRAEHGADVTLDALAAGAVGIITKPKIGTKAFLQSAADDLASAVRAAASVNLRNLRKPVATASSTPPHPAPTLPSAGLSNRLVAIGTSTGGTQALETVLTALPQACPALVIVQHMPERFTALFSERLDSLCRISVREARDGDQVMLGQALIAPGGRHMTVRRVGTRYVIDVSDGPLVNRHKPSVDVLFRSVAQAAGKNALGIIMTGMGNDGARGLQEMHEAGSRTLAQDEASCVVYGMPAEAVKAGAVDRTVPLPAVAAEIMAFAA